MLSGQLQFRHRALSDSDIKRSSGDKIDLSCLQSNIHAYPDCQIVNFPSRFAKLLIDLD